CTSSSGSSSSPESWAWASTSSGTTCASSGGGEEMDLISELRSILTDPESVRDDGGEVERHGSSVFTYHDPRLPDAVVYPKSRDEVAEILRFADDRGVPVIPFGQGSSLEGHTIPARGGISLD